MIELFFQFRQDKDAVQQVVSKNVINAGNLDNSVYGGTTNILPTWCEERSPNVPQIATKENWFSIELNGDAFL